MYRLDERQEDRISFDEHAQRYAREAFAALAGTDEPLALTDDMLQAHRESFLDGLEVDNAEEAIARFDDAFRRAWQEELAETITECAFPLHGGEYIDLGTEGSFTAYGLTTDGGDIIYIGSYHDAETETDRAAELFVTLEESVEDLLPGWRQATGEEISAACAGSWAEQHIYFKQYDVFEDNAGGIYLFVHSDDGIEYSFEYTGTPTGQLRDDLAELHRTGTTADWDHEFCLPEPEQTLETLRRWVDEGTGGAKLIADQDGVYLDRAGVAGRLALGDELYTVAEAAEALELSEPRVRVLCQEGRMGKKVGRDWVISAEDIETMKDRPGPGRPHKMVACDVLWSKALGEITLYAIGEANGRYFFSWSEWRWPVQGAEGDEVPANDIDDGENGISWFGTTKDAIAAAEDCMEALHAEHEDWAWDAVDELTEIAMTHDDETTVYVHLTHTAHGLPIYRISTEFNPAYANLPDRNVANPPPVRTLGPFVLMHFDDLEEAAKDAVATVTDVNLDDPGTWFKN